MANSIQLPDDIELAKQVISNQSKESGHLGLIFGTKEHAPTNIAALALVLFIMLLLVAMMAPLAADVPRGSIITALISAITFTLGLIFGRGNSSSSE
jgi:hypothetical protein